MACSMTGLVALPRRGPRAILVALISLVTVVGAAAYADGQLALQLSSVLGQERRGLSAAPEARLLAVTAPAEGRLPEAPSIDYSESFLAAQPGASGDAEWECLTQALYFEARGERARGLFAVAEVIMNRVESGRFPGSVCGVIHQGTGRQYQCQFTYTCDGRSDVVREPAAWSRVGKVARLMLDGAPRALTNGATYYHTRAVRPSWANSFPRTASIGAHLFYRGRATG